MAIYFLFELALTMGIAAIVFAKVPLWFYALLGFYGFVCANRGAIIERRKYL